jgi:methionyl aminopeptidase
MDEILQNLKIAEKAWIEARNVALKEVKVGAKLLDVAEKVESKIKKTCEIAFPINISRNNEAAHYSPKSDCEEIFKENDLIKIDIGTHSKGYIVDAAFTINLGKNNTEILNASKDALNKAIEYIKKEKDNTEYGKLGEIIENTILKYKNCKPIYNLTGHTLEQYNLHAGKSIFNHSSDNKSKFGKGIFAIEPFATNGSGFIKNGNFCSIYSYNNSNIRLPNARKLADEAKNYKMPFSERWIGNKLDQINKQMAINNLVKNKCIHEHPVLIDIKESFVSQHEKTVYIDNNNEVHIFPNIDY